MNRKQILGVTLSLSFCAQSSQAALVDWLGGTDTAWLTATNWSGPPTPPTNDTLTDIARFNQASYPNQPDAGTTSINGLVFGGTSGAVTLSGTQLTIGSSGIDKQAGSAAVTISSPITLDTAQTWQNNSATGLTIGTGAITNGANTLSVNGTGTTTISGILGGGAGGLTKSGTGTLIMSGANTYTGATAVQNGILNLQGGVNRLAATTALTLGSGTNSGVLRLGTAAVAAGQTLSSLTTSGTGTSNAVVGGASVSSGLTLSFDSGTIVYNGTLGGSGTNENNLTLTRTGSAASLAASVLQLAGSTANTFTGLTTVNVGRLELNKTAGVNAIGGNLTVSPITSAGGTGTITASVVWLASNQIPDTATLTLATANSRAPGANLGAFSETIGGLTVSSNFTGTAIAPFSGTGTLTVNGPISLTGSGTNTLTIGNIKLNLAGSAQTFTIANSGSGAVIVSSVIENGALTKAGSAALTLSGANTYAGATTVSAGSLSVNSIKNVGGGASSLGAPTTAANGVINLTGSAVGLTYTGTGDTSDRAINPGTSTGTTTLTQSGTGLLKITGAVTGVGTLGTAGTRTLALAGSTAGTGELGGVISNFDPTVPTAVTKTGTGTWTLSGVNLYTGPTTVSAGLLAINGSTAAGSALTVDATGIVGGSGTVNGISIVNGSVAPGNSVGTLGFANGLTVNGTYLLETAAGSQADLLNVTGTLTLGAASILDLTTSLVPSETYVIANYSALSGTFFNVDSAILATHSISYGSNQISLIPLAVPEPSTLVFSAIGVLGFALIRRRAVCNSN